jgi:AcrR family transcriptional regulator
MAKRSEKDAKGVEPAGGAQDVRARLLSCALTIFTTKGYAATTVREIVEAAGVTKPVLYYYYGSKEGIYLALFAKPHDRFLESLEESLGREGSSADRIRWLLERNYDLFMEHREVARLGYSTYFGPPQGAPYFDYEMFHMKSQETIHTLVSRGIESGEFRDGDADAMTLALLAVQNFTTEIELCEKSFQIGREGIGRLLAVLFDGMKTGEKARGKRKKP